MPERPRADLGEEEERATLISSEVMGEKGLVGKGGKEYDRVSEGGIGVLVKNVTNKFWVRLYGLGSLLYASGIVQNGVCHSGTPLVRYCTPLKDWYRLIWLREGSDQVPPVCDSFTVLTATEATPSLGG